MKISYPAIIKFSSKDKVYNVEFPDLPGCTTYGDSEEEALKNAQEVLSGYLESIDSRKLCIPESSKIKGKDIHLITPEKKISFAIFTADRSDSKVPDSPT